MRKRFECQLELGQTAIEQVLIPLKSRDELPPILAGLQWIFLTPGVNKAVFQVLEQKVQGTKQQTGRPGMDLWHILVLGVTRLGLDCNYDRLNTTPITTSCYERSSDSLRSKKAAGVFIRKLSVKMSAWSMRNSWHKSTPLWLAMDAESLKKKDDEKIAAKTDSYVLETNVHFPTDINLLWDGARKCIELSSRLSDRLNVGGWRKSQQWKKRIKGLMRQLGKINQGGGKNKEERLKTAVKAYLGKALELDRKVTANLEELVSKVTEPTEMLVLEEIRYFHQMLVKQIDLVDRRLLQGEKIPHQEKVFSLFEPHTQWIAKGKTWPPIELGHKLLITTDQNQLVLDYKIMEQTVDQAETLPLARRLFERYGEEAFGSMSFDKGFSNEADREELERQVGLVVMPKKGRRNSQDRERESAPSFLRTKNQHSAVESEINSLEHHGLNRCPDKGMTGYQRYVGLGILAYNLHQIGKRLLAKKRTAQKKRKAAA